MLPVSPAWRIGEASGGQEIRAGGAFGQEVDDPFNGRLPRYTYAVWQPTNIYLTGLSPCSMSVPPYWFWGRSPPCSLGRTIFITVTPRIAFGVCLPPLRRSLCLKLFPKRRKCCFRVALHYGTLSRNATSKDQATLASRMWCPSKWNSSRARPLSSALSAMALQRVAYIKSTYYIK